MEKEDDDDDDEEEGVVTVDEGFTVVDGFSVKGDTLPEFVEDGGGGDNIDRITVLTPFVTVCIVGNVDSSEEDTDTEADDTDTEAEDPLGGTVVTQELTVFTVSIPVLMTAVVAVVTTCEPGMGTDNTESGGSFFCV